MKGIFIEIEAYLTKKFKYHSDRNNKNLITNKEHRVIFNPPKTINKSEINKALSSINSEIDKVAEEFYKTKKKTMAYHYKSSFSYALIF